VLVGARVDPAERFKYDPPPIGPTNAIRPIRPHYPKKIINVPEGTDSMPHATPCRSCTATSLESILKWEPTAPSSPPGVAVVVGPGSSEELAFCPNCTLVQRITPPNASAQHDSSARAEMAAWPSRQLVSQVIATQKLRPTSLVIQIGSRDGRMLTDYQAAGIPVLGIEPAVRLAELARLEYGVPTLCRYFDKYVAAHLFACGQPADVVHLHCVLPRVSEPDSVVAGLPILLKDTGVAVIEVPYVRAMLERGDFWSAHHRELSYFSLTSLERLLTRHQMVIHDVERSADGGSSLRLFVGKRGQTSARVTALLGEESGWGVDRPATYHPRRQVKVA